jgi:hypothetical protein
MHEIEELHPAATAVMTGANQSAGDLQGGEQRHHPLPLVVVGEAGQGSGGGSFNQPCARSRAWMWGFSSTARTSPFSGGLR